LDRKIIVLNSLSAGACGKCVVGNIIFPDSQKPAQLFLTRTEVIILENLMEQIRGERPTDRKFDKGEGESVMEFRVFPLAGSDNSRVPGKLRAPPKINLNEVKKERLFKFDFFGGTWPLMVLALISIAWMHISNKGVRKSGLYATETLAGSIRFISILKSSRFWNSMVNL
ncbi:MAG: hypothetical protein PHG00_01080, partial [Methylococcales bacterium]|nr:hypothetical protein [Methylococcales bacterium]